MKIKKLSKFNNYFKMDDELIIFNSLTQALIGLNKFEVEELKSALKKDLFSNNNFDNLIKAGILVEKNLDELNLVKEGMYRSRFFKDTLSLTIAPTLLCNFNCPYCYEKSTLKTPKMTKDTMDFLLKFVEERAASLTSLSITWYGGEPLLAIDVIEYLSNKLSKLAIEYNLNFNQQMTTNGYLLSENIVKKLIDLGIEHIQIPLDGYKEEHDKTRFITKDKASFNTIIKNLINIRKKHKKELNITIRYNMTRKNYQSFNDLIRYLDSLSLFDVLNIYPARINDSTDLEFKNTLSFDEFYEIVDQFNRIFPEIFDLDDINNFLPEVITNKCCADHVNSFVIDPTGDLYKCWEEIGKENKIGDLKSGIYRDKSINYFKNLLEDPTTDKSCKDCSILPFCMKGHCPKHNDDIIYDYCNINKKQFDDKIKSYFKKIGKEDIYRVSFWESL